MLVTEVPTVFDPTLPLYVPPLPNALDRRWVADSISVDGAVASIADLYAGAAAVQATGANQPTAGTVDGLRAITFDGTNDKLSTPVDLSAQTEFTFYGVVKIPTLPAATKIGLDAGGAFLATTTSNKWQLSGSAVPAVAATAIVAGQWMAVAGAVKVVGSGTSIARVLTSIDTAGVETSTSTFAAFGTLGVNNTAVALGSVWREWGIKIGTAHTLAQMAANVAALKAEYGI